MMTANVMPTFRHTGTGTMTSRAFDELNEAMLRRALEINPDSATICGKHDPYDRHLPH